MLRVVFLLIFFMRRAREEQVSERGAGGWLEIGFYLHREFCGAEITRREKQRLQGFKIFDGGTKSFMKIVLCL